VDRIGEWFKLLGGALEDWEIAAVSESRLRCTVTRRGRSGGRRVHVVYPRKSTAYDVAMTTVLETFGAKSVDATFEVANFEQLDERGFALLWEAEQTRCELLFSMGSESTDWFWRKARSGSVPIVSVCSKDPVLLGQMPDYTSGSGVNFAFTSLNLVPEVQLAYLSQLKPDLRAVAILVDRKNLSAMETQALPFEAACRRLGVEAFLVAVQEPARAAAELAELVPKALERMRGTDPGLRSSLLWITGSTSVFTEITVINRAAGHVPVLSAVPEVVRAGPDSAVVSIGVSFENNARLAAAYGLDILAGRARASDLKVGVLSPPDIAINFMKAREIGLQIPFSFFEMAENIYGPNGRVVRSRGRSVVARSSP
jgi:putative ABC transport system substrate-binding protein